MNKCKDIIEWTLEQVQKSTNSDGSLMDEFYFNRDKCLKRLESEFKKEALGKVKKSHVIIVFLKMISPNAIQAII